MSSICSPLQFTMLAAPVFALVCAVAGLSGEAVRLRGGVASATDTVVVAGFAAATLTAAIHIVFSYGHHISYAFVDNKPSYSYFPDAYPRYYLPLGAIVPLGCLIFIAALRDEGRRRAFNVAMIVAPMAFTVFGAPGNEAYLAELAKHPPLDVYKLVKKTPQASHDG